MSRPRFYDPKGTRYGIPTYPWKLAPDGLATYAQLRARGLRPGGQPVAAQIMWRSRRSPDRSGMRTALLYRLDLALPVRPMTEGRWAALAKANAARRVCPSCRLDRGYRIPPSLGVCALCADASVLAA